MKNVKFIHSILFSIVALVPFYSWAQNFVPGEVIVKMKDNVTAAGNQQFVGKASLQHKMALKRTWTKFDMYQFQLKPGQTVEQAVQNMMKNPDVEYAEPNYIFSKQSVGIEGQALSAADVQEVLAESGFSGGSGFSQSNAELEAEEAWASLGNAPFGETPIVAIIDSGVDYTHDVFQDSNAIWENPGEIPNNGIDDDGNGYIDDIRGWNFAYNNNDPMDDDNHGTHVAGIVLGMTQNILATNVAPAKIKLMPLKFLGASGQGSTSDAIEAINYAINNGATILNNSWGGGSYSQALEDAVISAYNNNVSFVAAAGNSNNDNDLSATYPASYSTPNVISIAATEDNDFLAYFSNFGAQSVHVASPGVSILSTIPGNSFAYSSGTSMAAPFVSGLAALMKYEAGEINGYQVRDIIYNNSVGIADLVQKVSSEARINALSAVSYVQTNSIDSYQPGAHELTRGPSSVGSSSQTFQDSSTAGGCGLVKMIWDQSQKGGGKNSGGSMPLVLGLLLVPVALIITMRVREQLRPINRRTHDRFKIDSDVKISVGGKNLVGSISSISLGGAKVDTAAMLQNGGIIKMAISSPDGQQQVEVEGCIVWSEEKKSYGVQFCNAEDSALSAIGNWTKGLMKI